jgi:hypothetical protein
MNGLHQEADVYRQSDRFWLPKSDVCAGARVRRHLSNESSNLSLMLIGNPFEERCEMAFDNTIFRLKCRVEEV